MAGDDATAWGFRATGLVFALAFVLTVTYLPHVDTSEERGADAGQAWPGLLSAYEDWWTGEREGYPFPIHVDEHIHWVFSSTIQRFETLSHPEIYTGKAPGGEGISLRGGVHERGFHLALGQFQDLTGVSWLTIFQYGPAVWAGLTAVLVWAALDPWPGAPIAAGLTGLMPTTVRFLGPGFLVPITFGLAWVAVILALLPRLGRTFQGPALALVTVFWAFFIHVIAGFVALALLLCAIPFVAGEAKHEGMRKRLAGIGVVAALPMIWLYEAFFEEILAEAQTLSGLPLDATVFDQIGLAFLGAWILGLGVVGYRSPKGRRTQFGACALLSLVLLATILTNFYGGPRLALYDRFHQPFLMLASIPAAAFVLFLARAIVKGIRQGARWARRQTRDVWYEKGDGASGASRASSTTSTSSTSSTTSTTSTTSGGGLPGAVVALFSVLLFVGLTAPGVAGSLNEPYYRVLEEEDIDRFEWVEENLGTEHERFLAHPWKAPVLTAKTGMQPHAFLRPGSPPINGADYIDYVTGTDNDTRWLLERDIEVVVGPRTPDSELFYEPVEGVSVLEEEYARQQEARRGPAPPS